MQSIVVIPTYNEKDTIGAVIRRIHDTEPAMHVLVVDDGSPDGTGDLADEIASRDPRVHVMHRTEKNGLGAAYIAGFGWALDRGYELIIEMDADGSHQPEQLPALIESIETGADLTIGTRWISGGRTVNWPFYRKLISRAGTTYARIMLSSRLHDITSGYRGFRAAALRAIDFDSLNSQGYCFQIEMAWLLERSGYSVREFPITFVERLEGHSKMSSGIVLEALKKVTQWGIASRTGKLQGVQSKARTTDATPL